MPRDAAFALCGGSHRPHSPMEAWYASPQLIRRKGRLRRNFEKGKVSQVRIVDGLDEEIDAQVVKVIGASPKWKPALVAGKPVSVKISVPVEFKLAKSGSFKIKK